MISSLDYGWRFIATGLAYSVFGVGGLLLRLIYFPLLHIIVRNHLRRVGLARLAVHHSFRVLVWLMKAMGILSYEINGAEKLRRQGLLILSNHPTLLDVVFLISLVPNADCVVRSGLARNPFTRGPVKATGYICNDSGAGLVDDCIRSVKSGNNLIIFPEGTRTPIDGKMTLRRGAANVAVRGILNITPVVIRCAPLSLSKGAPWWKIPPCSAHFTIDVQDDIQVMPFIDAAEAPLAARQLTDYLIIIFQRRKRHMQALEQEIKTLLIEALNLEDTKPEDIDSNQTLFAEGLGLDSIDALELGLALQKHFGVTMTADSEETKRHFSNVRSLAEFVAANRRHAVSNHG